MTDRPLSSGTRWGVWLVNGGVYIGPGIPPRGAEFHDTGISAPDFEVAADAAAAFVSLKRKEKAIMDELKAERKAKRAAREAEKAKQGVLPSG